MREIKFRGKSVRTGEWRYGWLVGYSEHMSYIYGDYVDKDEVWEVLTSTVGQFTGLLDKNGKEIYEGDIVKVHDVLKNYCAKNHEFTGKVEFAFASFKINDNNFINHYRWIDYELEIIGNIYENPEFVKEETV